MVFGEGRGTSQLLLLGEAPGQEEDRRGRPFVGRAGRILDGLLAEAGIDRAASFVTNTVLCRALVVHASGAREDRRPTDVEVGACAPHLDAQLYAVRPAVIVTLGATALHRLLGPGREVERDHGRVFALQSALVVPSFHPAALHWRAGRREAALVDLRLAKSLLS